MMVGEFDYTNILVDSESKRNNITGAPLVPFPEVSYVVFYLFVLIISVALMNLLVSFVVTLSNLFFNSFPTLKVKITCSNASRPVLAV